MTAKPDIPNDNSSGDNRLKFLLNEAAFGDTPISEVAAQIRDIRAAGGQAKQAEIATSDVG